MLFDPTAQAFYEVLQQSRNVQLNKTLDIFSLESQYLLMTLYIQVSPQGNNTTLFGRVWNGCLHDFKFAETCSNFRTILQYPLYSHNAWIDFYHNSLESQANVKIVHNSVLMVMFLLLLLISQLFSRLSVITSSFVTLQLPGSNQIYIYFLQFRQSVRPKHLKTGRTVGPRNFISSQS